MQTIRAYVNGKLVEIGGRGSVADLRSAAGVGAGETLAEVSGKRAEVAQAGDAVKPNARYRSIPPIVQG